MVRFRVGDLGSAFVQLVEQKGLDADRNGVLDARDLPAMSTAKAESQGEVEKLQQLRDAVSTGRAPRTAFVSQRIERALELVPAEQPWYIAHFPNALYRPLFERPATLAHKSDLDEDALRAMTIDERLRLLSTYRSPRDVDDIARGAVDKIPVHQRELFRSAVQGEKYEIAALLAAERAPAWEQERRDELSLLTTDERLAWLSDFATAGHCADPSALAIVRLAPDFQRDALASAASTAGTPCAVLVESEVRRRDGEQEKRAAAIEAEKAAKIERAREASMAQVREQEKAQRDLAAAEATRRSYAQAERAIVATARSLVAKSDGDPFERCAGFTAVINQARGLPAASPLRALVRDEPESCARNGAYEYMGAVVASIAVYQPGDQ